MGRKIGTASMLAILGLASGCISVRAPDKPIEINLNIKIDANVVVALQKDTKDLIDKNPELFPE
jgi:hypothetical protein